MQQYAYGCWFALNVRHSVRLTYIGLGLFCGCLGALEYPTKVLCVMINKADVTLLYFMYWGCDKSVRSMNKSLGM